MKQTKAIIFICGGLMAIATIYGAIDLATSGELTNLYAEKPEQPAVTETAAKEELKPAATEVAREEQIVEKREVKKRKKKAHKKAEFVVEQQVEETETEEKEIRSEMFSRGAINKRPKKEITQVDTVKKGSFAVTNN